MNLTYSRSETENERKARHDQHDGTGADQSISRTNIEVVRPQRNEVVGRNASIVERSLRIRSHSKHHKPSSKRQHIQRDANGIDDTNMASFGASVDIVSLLLKVGDGDFILKTGRHDRIRNKQEVATRRFQTKRKDKKEKKKNRKGKRNNKVGER